MDKFSTWIYGLLGTIVGFICVENVRFRRNISKEYALREDFVRFMNENRLGHQRIFDKLDQGFAKIGDKLDKKADK